MAHRKPRREERASAGVGARKRYRAPIAFSALTAAIVVFSAIAFQAPPVYVACIETPFQKVQDISWQLYIQVGERSGQLNISFIRLPEGLGVKASCRWPIYVTGNPGDRGAYYTMVQVESPYDYSYTLGDFFKMWGAWYGYPAPVYFEQDGVSFYRNTTVSLLVHRGWADPFNNTYEFTFENLGYGRYVPSNGDWVELIIHDPYTTFSTPHY